MDYSGLGIKNEGNQSPPKLYNATLKAHGIWILVEPMENISTSQSKLIEVAAKYKDIMVGKVISVPAKFEGQISVGDKLLYKKLAEFTVFIDDKRYVLVKGEPDFLIGIQND